MPLRPSLAARLNGRSVGGGANSPLLLDGQTTLSDTVGGALNDGEEEEEEEDDGEDSTMTGMAPPPYGPRTKSSMSQVSHRSNNSFRSTKSFREGSARG